MALCIGIVLLLFDFRFFDFDLGSVSPGPALATLIGVQCLHILLFPKYMEEKRRHEIKFFSPIRRFLCVKTQGLKRHGSHFMVRVGPKVKGDT